VVNPRIPGWALEVLGHGQHRPVDGSSTTTAHRAPVLLEDVVELPLERRVDGQRHVALLARHHQPPCASRLRLGEHVLLGQQRAQGG
jgi:hypothetical protein